MHIKIAKSKEDSQHISELAHHIWHEHYPSIITEEQIDYMLRKFQTADTIYSEITNGTTYLMAYKARYSLDTPHSIKKMATYS
ncbi:hypothetical protein [Listeria cornellensis]|uniref:hypothetical protein n=1 Tax=Listeria cornellensis TaxID=1494961 RepID=UPI0004B7697E|nr:hypothetical protein [Listeria cornellensis]